MLRISPQNFSIIASALSLLTFAATGLGQSSEQTFPTAVTSKEIVGQIKSRDIGDSRLTTYFYAFDGVQGDVFINVVTKNFNGDIDIFTADNMRPLTKMVIYADNGLNETGRLIYLRKSEHLLLRIEGRSLNDDSATYRIKFAGTFVALAAQKVDQAPVIERIGSGDKTGSKVNSVGTIIEVKPTQPPQPVKKIENVVKEPAAPVIGEKPKEKKQPSSDKKVHNAAKEQVVKDNQNEKKPDTTVDKKEPEPSKTESETKTETVFENKNAKVTVEPAPKPTKTTTPKVKNTPGTAKATKQVPKQLQGDPDVNRQIRLRIFIW